MAIEDVGVRFVTEGERQFEATIKRADSAVDNFGKTATKNADQVSSKWSTMMKTLSSPEGLKFMMGAATAAAGALVAVGAGIKKLADDYMNYAFQVKDFGRIIGATPEQASRLIQVADDVRLSVGSLTIAMRTAITKGYSPTVEGLGQIADAYLAIQDPIQRSKFLIETFGRSGLEMAKLMEKGGAGIRAMSAAIEDGLIVDQKGIDQAQKYYDALDLLNDRWTTLRMQAGAIVLPIVIQGLEEAPKLIDDAENVIEMFSALQKGMTKGVVSPLGVFGPDPASYLNQYLTAEKSASQIISEVNQRIKEQDQANRLAVSGMQILNNEWRISELILGTFPSRYQTTTSAIWGTNTAIQTMSSSAWDSTDAFKSMTSVIDQDVINAAQKLSQQKISVEMGLEFKAPDIAGQMQNLIKSVDWKAAGGAALETFMQGFAAQAAPMTDEQKKKVAAQVGAVDIALKVNTGEIDKSEGIKKLMDLANLDYSQAKTQLESIMKLQPTDIGPYLNQLMQLSAPETTTAAATNITNLNTSITNLGSSFSTNQTLMSSWNGELATMGTNATTSTGAQEFLNEKIVGTGFAVQQNIGNARDWTSAMEDMGTNADDAADYVNNVNYAIKALPKSTTLDIYINVHGSIPGGGGGGGTPKPLTDKEKKELLKASGGPVYGNTLYLVGEEGPELFVPDVSGTIIPNDRTMSILDSATMIIPLAKGGKMTSAEEKAHNREVKERQGRSSGGGGDGGNEGGGDEVTPVPILDQGNDVLDALRARETIAWDLVQSSVAEYNALIKSGVSPAELIDKRRMIDQSVQEAQSLTKLRIEAERQVTLLESQSDTSEGLESTSTWLGKLINQFKEFFDLLTSSAAKEAIDIINPLVSQSPAPLALGLSQIGREMSSMSATSIPRFSESIAQLANPARIYQNQTSTYNVNVPVTATVRNEADIQSLAYQIAKIFVRETR